MGSVVSGLLGLAGGSNGTGYSAPQAAQVVNPTNQTQIQNAYNASQAGLGQQTNLLQGLQSQNGLNNQSNVYNQLQGVVAGTGPNPAQAMLNNQTGANVANQAALMAGQRGSSANAGLLARQAAQQGAGIQQAAVGQAANLQANQSLNALGQAGNIANSQVSNQIGQTNANVGAQQNQQNMLYGAQQGVNNANVQMQSSINSGNAALAGQTMQGQQGLFGGALNAVSTLFADGGAVHTPTSKFGQFLHAFSNPPQAAASGQAPVNPLYAGMTSLGQKVGNAATNFLTGPDSFYGQTQIQGQPSYGVIDPSMDLAKGGKVPAMLSPGEKYLSPREALAAKHGKNPMSMGKTIPGKPKVDGAKNSYANDVVPATLEEGGIVLPRSVTKSKNPEKAAAAFVRKVMARK